MKFAIIAVLFGVFVAALSVPVERDLVQPAHLARVPLESFGGARRALVPSPRLTREAPGASDGELEGAESGFYPYYVYHYPYYVIGK